jgi:hypothetical protein
MDRMLIFVIMRWIFQNELKVWKNRGGRPASTLEGLLSFVEPPVYEQGSYYLYYWITIVTFQLKMI